MLSFYQQFPLYEFFYLSLSVTQIRSKSTDNVNSFYFLSWFRFLTFWHFLLLQSHYQFYFALFSFIIICIILIYYVFCCLFLSLGLALFVLSVSGRSAGLWQVSLREAVCARLHPGAQQPEWRTQGGARVCGQHARPHQHLPSPARPPQSCGHLHLRRLLPGGRAEGPGTSQFTDAEFRWDHTPPPLLPECAE